MSSIFTVGSDARMARFDRFSRAIRDPEVLRHTRVKHGFGTANVREITLTDPGVNHARSQHFRDNIFEWEKILEFEFVSEDILKINVWEA